MKMKRFNILTIFSLIFMLSFFSLNTYAADKSGEKINIEVENNTKGSITVNIGTIKGIKIYVSKIAEIKDGQLIILEEFNKFGIDLNNVKTAEELQKEIKKIKLDDSYKKMSVDTDENGNAIFVDLEPGAYYICSDNPKNKEQIESTIVSIPKYDEEEGNMVYEIKVEPKHETPKQAPQTSLSDNMLLFTAISLACALAASILFKLSKSKKNEKI